jgi:uncharacterized protein (TIGR00369 family)
MTEQRGASGAGGGAGEAGGSGGAGGSRDAQPGGDGSAAGGALVDQARGWLADLFAPWVQSLRLQPERVEAGEVVLRLPFDARLCRVGGTICGQALMAAADTSMVIAISAHLGGFRPMTTVSQTTSFMRAVADDDVLVTARVLKPGRTLCFGEIELASARDGRLAAHVTTTYAML